MEPQPDQLRTLSLRVSREGILETGLKKAITLLRKKLAAMAKSEEWNADDFFHTCKKPAGTYNCISEPGQSLGFPRNVQIVTLTPESQPVSIFARTERLSAQCRDNTNNWLQRIHNNEGYSLCIYNQQRDTAIPEYAVVIPDSPFVIKNRDGSYEGLAIDIFKRVVEELAKQNIVINLKFKEVTSYGTKGSNGKWSGVFGELAEPMWVGDAYDGMQNTMIGLGQVSMTRERLEDGRFTFSPAFAYTYYTFMVRKTSVYNAYLSFTRPFTEDVWMTLLLVLFLSGLYIFVLEKWNPFKQSPPDDGPTFTAQESFWHSFMVITQAGAPFGAYLLPSRVYSVFYWFFALVVCACYTGNLASFLTGSDLRLTWTKGDPSYTYGVVSNSSVSQYVQEHNMMGSQWGKMVANPVHVPNYAAGVQRVKSEKFVLIGTSLVMEDFVYQEEKCMYYIWKGSMYEMIYSDSKIEPIAFPMRKIWRFSKQFGQTMERLQEDGEIQKIYRKWIKRRDCTSESADDQSLSFDNFLGLFIPISVAVVVSYLFLAIKLIHLKLRDGNQREKTDVDNTEAEDRKECEVNVADIELVTHL